AIVVANETGHTSFPAAALSGSSDVEGDRLELLRTLPLPILYCGFVKYDVEGVDGTWMRTYGAGVLGLPDLAMLTAGHHEGQQTFNLIDRLFRYLLDSGATFAVGHTMQAGPDLFLRLRAPREDEGWLQGPGEVLVLERIRGDLVNRPRKGKG